MGLIDTHNHLYLEDFDPEQDQLIAAAKASGIEALLLPNVDTTTIERMHNLCDRYPDFTFPMMGLHPTSVEKDYAAALQETENWFTKRKYCGIGEIGIDLYWDKTYLKEQKEVFEEQLSWSIDMQLPVAIHCREAYPEVFDSMHKVGIEHMKGVFHCFTGTEEDLEEIQKMTGFKIGIGGVVTFKKSHLPTLLEGFHWPLDRILLETDAPYLAPVPHRGKRNEPTYIWDTAHKVAEIYRITTEEVVSETRKNSLTLFSLPTKE